MRFYRKSDTELLAAIVAERDEALASVNAERGKRIASELLSAEYARQLTASNERIRSLEEAQAKYVEAQRETVAKLLAASVESNVPVEHSHEEIKMQMKMPRSPIALAREQAIKTALKRRKPQA